MPITLVIGIAALAIWIFIMRHPFVTAVAALAGLLIWFNNGGS